MIPNVLDSPGRFKPLFPPKWFSDHSVPTFSAVASSINSSIIAPPAVTRQFLIISPWKYLLNSFLMSELLRMAVLPGFNTTRVHFNLAASSLYLLSFVSFEILLAICLDKLTIGPFFAASLEELLPVLSTLAFTASIVFVTFCTL